MKDQTFGENATGVLAYESFECDSCVRQWNFHNIVSMEMCMQ